MSQESSYIGYETFLGSIGQKLSNSLRYAIMSNSMVAYRTE